MTEELEQVLRQLQIQNQQIQNIMLQKQALLIQLKEIERALEAVEKNDDDIYKTVGPVLIKTTKNDINKELDENKEEIDLKIKTLERQEKKIKEKIKESQEKFQSLIPQKGQGG